MTSYGYAVANQTGVIFVETVSPREIGAIVNWLYTHTLARPTNATPDEEIRRIFAVEYRDLNVSVVKVSIRAVGLANGN